MCNRVRINALTKSELEAVIAAANFTPDQAVIFKEMNTDLLYDIGIMAKLGIPRNKYYDIKRITIDKTERVLKELGYNYATKAGTNRIQS